MMFRYAEWSESYHDDLQQGILPKPENRRQRVRALVKWLDRASDRAHHKLIERENMIMRMRSEGSPTQRMMEKMQKEQAAKEKAKAGGKAKDKEL